MKFSVRERRNPCITMIMILFLRLYPKILEFGSGSWNANVSEFCISNESMSDLERRDELYIVQPKRAFHFSGERKLRQRCSI